MKNNFIKNLFFITVLLSAAVLANPAEKSKNLKPGDDMKETINDITVKDMNNKDVNLSDYKGKVLLIVNVASECGYTPQYKDLEAIYEQYKDKGFEILAFPCNDFGGQEPGTNKKIKEFCTTNFNVTFKLFDKIKVLGSKKSPLYERLTNSPSIEQGDVQWNFEKFLISKKGKIVARYRSSVKPTNPKITAAIEHELKKAS